MPPSKDPVKLTPVLLTIRENIDAEIEATLSSIASKEADLERDYTYYTRLLRAKASQEVRDLGYTERTGDSSSVPIRLYNEEQLPQAQA